MWEEWGQGRGREGERGERKTRYSSQKAKGTKRTGNQNGWIIYGRAAHPPSVEEFRVSGRVCQSGRLYNR